MTKLLGGGLVSAAIGAFFLALGSSGAAKAQNASTEVQAAALVRPAVASTTSITASSGTVTQAAPAASVTMKLATSIATEAAWLYSAGWPLYALADRYSAGAPLNDEANCLATAVYFEARGETVDGQLAVARVIINRAASGRYPTTWCGVVKQPAQFSFVRHGRFPPIDYSSPAWSRALGVARLAMTNVVPSVGTDVLWYHADYVEPSWCRRLNMARKIGAHIFYRA